MSKEEKNILIAEAFMRWFKPDTTETEEALRDRRYELRHWTLHRTSGAPIENFSSYYWTPPDFYTDEAANALLVEKVSTDCKYDFSLEKRYDSMWEVWSGGYFLAESDDRKTAICEAALKRIDEEAR